MKPVYVILLIICIVVVIFLSRLMNKEDLKGLGCVIVIAIVGFVLLVIWYGILGANTR